MMGLLLGTQLKTKSIKTDYIHFWL